MRPARRTVAAVAALIVVGTLSGCSLDTVIWGPEGAAVIQQTDRVIAAAASGEADVLACPDSAADFGAPSDWQELGSGELEPFNPDRWPGREALDPAWTINLETGGSQLLSGQSYPADLLLRDDSAGLCVVEVAWAVIESAG